MAVNQIRKSIPPHHRNAMRHGNFLKKMKKKIRAALFRRGRKRLRKVQLPRDRPRAQLVYRVLALQLALRVRLRAVQIDVPVHFFKWKGSIQLRGFGKLGWVRRVRHREEIGMAQSLHIHTHKHISWVPMQNVIVRNHCDVTRKERLKLTSLALMRRRGS